MARLKQAVEMPEAPASGRWSRSAYRASDQSPGFWRWRGILPGQRRRNTMRRPSGFTGPQFANWAVGGWLSRKDGVTTQQHVAVVTSMDRLPIAETVSRPRGGKASPGPAKQNHLPLAERRLLAAVWQGCRGRVSRGVGGLSFGGGGRGGGGRPRPQGRRRWGARWRGSGR